MAHKSREERMAERNAASAGGGSGDAGNQRRQEKPRGKKGELQQQLDMVTNLVEEIRNIDSEIDLIKQKMNLIIREINVLKHVVLAEKQEIKLLEDEKEKDKGRFEGIINLVKEIKDRATP